MNAVIPKHKTPVPFLPSPQPPAPISRRHLSPPFSKIRKLYRPPSLGPISRCNFMADSRDEVFAQSENGGRNYSEIIVIRHGETEWNADRRIQGHLDVDLNDVGRQQAVAVAERLSKEPKISAVYSSDLKRAFYTAEVIAKSCGVPEVTKDPNLRERHLGDVQGVVLHEIAKTNPEAYKAFVSNHDDQEIPGGGESFNQLYNRCTLALQRIAKKHRGERVVVVSHGGTIRALHRKASPHRRPTGKVHNTSINVFWLTDEGEWSIKSWGDVSHLKETAFLESGFGGDRNSG